jgi:hypothetical protein
MSASGWLGSGRVCLIKTFFCVSFSRKWFKHLLVGWRCGRKKDICPSHYSHLNLRALGQKVEVLFK